jgi:hypothetical protein
MAKVEGVCHRGGSSTSSTPGSVNRVGRVGHGDGAIWESSDGGHAARNIRLGSPARRRQHRQHHREPARRILLCEDATVTDRYGPGTRLIALTGEGDSMRSQRTTSTSAEAARDCWQARRAQGLPGMSGRAPASRERRGALRQRPDAGHHLRYLGPWERGNLRKKEGDAPPSFYELRAAFAQEAVITGPHA